MTGTFIFEQPYEKGFLTVYNNIYLCMLTNVLFHLSPTSMRVGHLNISWKEKLNLGEVECMPKVTQLVIFFFFNLKALTFHRDLSSW